MRRREFLGWLGAALVAVPTLPRMALRRWRRRREMREFLRQFNALAGPNGATVRGMWTAEEGWINA